MAATECASTRIEQTWLKKQIGIAIAKLAKNKMSPRHVLCTKNSVRNNCATYIRQTLLFDQVQFFTLQTEKLLRNESINLFSHFSVQLKYVKTYPSEFDLDIIRYVVGLEFVRIGMLSANFYHCICF